LKLHVENLRQELADQLKEHNRQIETNFARHEMSVRELSDKYEQKLAAVAKEADDHHKQVLEEIHAEYAVQIADLKRTHEAQLERTAQDVESTYTDVIAELKSSHSSSVEDYRSQIAQLRREIGDVHEDAGNQDDMNGTCVDDLTSQLELARDTISRLEGQIREFSEHENLLNAELEETKLDRERRVSEQERVMQGLRAEIEALSTSEAHLRQQLDETNKHWNERLTELSAENTAAVENLSGLLQTNQSEVLNILRELEAAQRQLAETSSLLEERSVALEETRRKLSSVNEELSQSCANEQKLGERIEQAEAQCVMLVEKVSVYEQQIIGNGADDSSAMAELMRRISELEQHLLKKDQAIGDFEKRVRDFGEQISRETTEAKARSQLVEQLLLDNERLLHEKEALTSNQSATIADLEQRVMDMQNIIDDKNGELSEAEARMLQAQANFDSQTESLKTRLKEHEDELEKAGAFADSDPEQRMKKLREDFSRECASLQEENKFLRKNLAAERENLRIFKDSVRKQFDERKQQVCSPILTTVTKYLFATVQLFCVNMCSLFNLYVEFYSGFV